MGLNQIVKKAKLSLARMPVFSYGHLPENPVYLLRDLWQGDSMLGMYLVKGELIYYDHIIPLYPGVWANKDTSPEILRKIHGFSWLRDMRELGTENARVTARGLVMDWMDMSVSQHSQQAYQPDILATRLVNWLGHYDFFAASADSSFHQYFMRRVVSEGRYILAQLPAQVKSHENFTLLKGAMALALCCPEQFDIIPRLTKYLQEELEAQILDDGVHIERNPEIQLLVLQDLVEIRLMYNIINIRPPAELITALDTTSRALRGLRHGDGGLALFNGASEGNVPFIDRVLSHATQKRVAMADMRQGGYQRCHTNRVTLIVDSGKPPAISGKIKHAGLLSFEFSVGRQRLIVNCGTGVSSIWQSALSGTAAHSVLKLADRDAVSFSYDHLSDPSDSDLEVTTIHEVQDGAHWLELTHNGWGKDFGAIYYRKLYLSSNGMDLRGEEYVKADQDAEFVIRFHLHPSVMVEEKEISLPKGKMERIFVLKFNHKHEGRQEWWFRYSGVEGRLEPSVYFGHKLQQDTKQIVLYGSIRQNVVSSTSGSGFNRQNPVNQQEHKARHADESDGFSSGTGMDPSSVKKTEDSAYVAIFHHQDDDPSARNGSGQADYYREDSEERLARAEQSQEQAGITPQAGYENRSGTMDDRDHEPVHVENSRAGSKPCSGAAGLHLTDEIEEVFAEPVIVRWGLQRKS